MTFRQQALLLSSSDLIGCDFTKRSLFLSLRLVEKDGKEIGTF